MKVLGIIPARFASTRFPGKPLAHIHGKSMIQRVYERASLSGKLSLVVVATDDQRIFDHVKEFNGEVVMTSPSHASGTDRCAEALKIKGKDFEVVVNIQGDEPYIHPGQIDLLVDCFQNKEVLIGTLIKKVKTAEELQNQNIPKVVKDLAGWALYFSRQAVPFCKPEQMEDFISRGNFYKHIGIYGFRAEVLAVLALLPASRLETSESLEQLRWLENGYKIMTRITEQDNMAVDNPGDVARIEARYDKSD